MKRSAFDLTFEHKTTCRLGQLVPVMCKMVMPGDTFKCHGEGFARLMPLIAPMMHSVRLCAEYWYVPMRLVWKDYEDFLGGGKDGKQEPVMPYITSPEGGFKVGSLADHLGLPVNVANLKVCALPFRSIALTYNEAYRSGFLQDEVPLSIESGEDTTTNQEMLVRNWERDRFTDALPFAQVGDPVYLPLGKEAPVVPVDADGWKIDGEVIGRRNDSWSSGLTTYHIADIGSSSGNTWATPGPITDVGLKSDMTKTTAMTMDDFNAAYKISLWKQRTARGGYRLVELLLSHFGVRSSDASLQRPEFLGGGSSYISVSEVLQTSSTDTTSPQGNMAGHALSYNTMPKFKRFFDDFGYVICFLSVMPRTGYFQGIDPMWSIQTKWDMPFPEFDHLGEQKVLNKEVCATGTERDNETFGFIPRFNEYRYSMNTVSGEFRNTLKFWHLDRDFDTSNPPALNAEFLQCKPSDRVFAVENGDHVLIDWVHHLKALRPLSKYGVPKL